MATTLEAEPAGVDDDDLTAEPGRTGSELASPLPSALLEKAAPVLRPAPPVSPPRPTDEDRSVAAFLSPIRSALA